MAAKSCMSGRTVELSEAGDRVCIRFPFHPELLTVVRGLSQRRFDQIAKCWSCPVDDIVAVVDALRPHGFAIAAPARAVYGRRGGTQQPAVELTDTTVPPPPRCTAGQPSAPKHPT